MHGRRVESSDGDVFCVLVTNIEVRFGQISVNKEKAHDNAPGKAYRENLSFQAPCK